MRYSAPDYEVVSVQVKNAFANYLVTGCPPDEGESDNMNENCAYNTYVTLGLAFMCYSTWNP